MENGASAEGLEIKIRQRATFCRPVRLGTEDPDFKQTGSPLSSRPNAQTAILFSARIRPDEAPRHGIAQVFPNALPAVLHDKPASVRGNLGRHLGPTTIAHCNDRRVQELTN